MAIRKLSWQRCVVSFCKGSCSCMLYCFMNAQRCCIEDAVVAFCRGNKGASVILPGRPISSRRFSNAISSSSPVTDRLCCC